MSIALPEAIQQAQQALEYSDYQEAIATCSAIIDEYPACEAAYRLLGEALLEQGQIDEAERAYSRAIDHDPRQPASYLGLGRIAEDRGVLDNALAYCQVAWELAPNVPEYREPVIQVASRWFGDDGQLQLTHAALAQIHLRGSRMQRAVREYQLALSALPDRVDLWLGLAESLWRLGQDVEAAEIAGEVLEEHPDPLQALVILADIEHRRGNSAAADHYLERLRQIDPDGAAVRAMADRNSQAASDYLLLSDADVPLVEPVEFEPAVAGSQAQPAPADDAPLADLVAQFDASTAREHDAAGGDDDLADLIAQFDAIQPVSLDEFDAEPGEPLPVAEQAGDAPASGEDDALLSLATSLEDSAVDVLDFTGHPIEEPVAPPPATLDEPYIDAIIDEEVAGLEGLEDLEPAVIEELDDGAEEHAFRIEPPSWQQADDLSLPSEGELASESAAWPEFPPVEADDSVAEEIAGGAEDGGPVVATGQPVPAPDPAIAEETTAVPVASGATRDPEVLGADLQAAPDDDESHWSLAEALREQGATAEAMTEYRWLIRNTPARHDSVMTALNACIAEGDEVEMAHRLLADIYRRRGDRAMASSQAQMAMKARLSSRS